MTFGVPQVSVFGPLYLHIFFFFIILLLGMSLLEAVAS